MAIQLLDPPIELRGQRVVLSKLFPLFIARGQSCAFALSGSPPVPNDAGRLYQNHKAHRFVLGAGRALAADHAVILLLAHRGLVFVIHR